MQFKHELEKTVQNVQKTRLREVFFNQAMNELEAKWKLV